MAKKKKNRLTAYKIDKWLDTLVESRILSHQYCEVQKKSLRLQVKRGFAPWNGELSGTPGTKDED